MSRVTNIVLAFGASEHDEMFPQLQALVRERHIGPLGDLTDDRTEVAERGVRWGGTKYPEVELYGAASNYLDLPAFMALMQSISWKEPDHLQLFVRGQDDSKFTVFELVGSHWVALRHVGD